MVWADCRLLRRPLLDSRRVVGLRVGLVLRLRLLAGRLAVGGRRLLVAELLVWVGRIAAFVVLRLVSEFAYVFLMLIVEGRQLKVSWIWKLFSCPWTKWTEMVFASVELIPRPLSLGRVRILLRLLAD